MPVTQLYRPANLYAVYNDHDYLNLNQEASFIETENVCIYALDFDEHTDTPGHILPFHR
jgi:hypothetical protein